MFFFDSVILLRHEAAGGASNARLLPPPPGFPKTEQNKKKNNLACKKCGARVRNRNETQVITLLDVEGGGGQGGAGWEGLLA